MKNTLRKIIAALLCLAMVFAFAACSGNDTDTDTTTGAPDTAKELKIGIIQYASHPSLDNCYQGIINALEKSDLDYTVDRQIGSDNAADSDCASFAKTMVAQKYDLIFAIATPAAPEPLKTTVQSESCFLTILSALTTAARQTTAVPC